MKDSEVPARLAAQHSPRDLFAPTATIISLAVVLLLGALFFVSQQADKVARAHEEAVVANGLNVRISEIAAAAYARMASERVLPDNSAATANAAALLTPLHEYDGFESAFLLDVAGASISALVDGAITAPDAFTAFESAASGLVASVRQAEAVQRDAGFAQRGPVQTSAAAAIGGRVYILTATLAPSAIRNAPILVTADDINEDFVATLMDRFLLDDLRVQSDARVDADNRARIPLTSFDGATIAHLEWTPRTPGAVLLHQALPPVVILIVSLGAFAWLLHRRGQRAAKSLLASEARATHLAYHDALTGLPNRLMLSERLSRAVEGLRRSGTPFAVHCIDLDRFKDVNDTFGHQAGDELIRMAGERISSACRQLDTVARLGGDEFAVVQIDADPDGAATLADRIVGLLSAPMELSVGNVHIGASVGVMLSKDPDLDPQECLRQADLALYRVKDNGRNGFCFFEPEMDAAVRLRRELEDDLRDAITSEALEMAYQPQVDGQGVMIGVEALVRWTHPVRGSVSPTVFVPVAEECGLIDFLGFFTLRCAFADSARWPGLKVALNISATQIRMRDFVERVAALAQKMGVNPAQFELEITESVLLIDDPQTQDSLRRLRELGFSLALDDFGTGYSSLSYLQRYPIDKIKIDRSFVANLGVEDEADAVVGAIVRLARALNLNVIAEGVETEEQRMRLVRTGCTEMQGFLFGHPGPAAAIDKLIASREDQPVSARA